MIDDIAISVKEVTKTYKLYDTHADRVKESFHPFRKKYHHPFNALANISFEVKRGETIGIIGQNGSGKSTLLQIICCILQPTSGNVEVYGRLSALLELGAGFNPECTGRQNIYMNCAILGLTREEIDARFDDIVAFADIGDFIDQPVKIYSSGMYVRLAFAVIAHVDAQILIVDEALAVGDASYVQKCMRFIRQFCENGTLFFVSHDTQSILDLCDRAIWLDRGRIQSDGYARDVVREYNAFIHSLVISDETIQVHKDTKGVFPNEKGRFCDHRKKLLTSSEHRNLFELFDFDLNSPWWGKGDAHVINIKLFNTHGQQISVTEGAELVELRIYCRTNIELRKPVVGFSIRNQRGLELISDNTYITYKDTLPPTILPREYFYASFKFMLPYLKPGNYTIGGAIADGVPGAHIQHHRGDEALHFKVHASHIIYGLFGMPIVECSIEKFNS